MARAIFVSCAMVVNAMCWPGLAYSQNATEISWLGEFKRTFPGVEFKEGKDAEIVSVDFSKCEVEMTETISKLSELRTLQSVTLSGAKTPPARLVALEKLVQIRMLKLDSFSDAGLAHIAGLVNLRNLSLAGQGVTDAGMTHLAKLENVAALTMQDCRVTDKGLKILVGMAKLKEFTLVKADGGDGALMALANAKGLTKLRLKNCSVTDHGIAMHLSSLLSLSVIDLGECRVGDASLAVIANHPKLEDVNMLRTQVTNEGIALLCAMRLKRLNLDDVQGIDDSAIVSIAKMTTLEFLHLGKTKVTDSGILGLRSLVNLKDLILNDTAVTELGVQSLQKVLPQLTIKK
jgi:hypothetical protein